MSIVESEELGSGGKGVEGDEAVELDEEDLAATITVWPFLASVTAICRPIPLEAPITTATRAIPSSGEEEVDTRSCLWPLPHSRDVYSSTLTRIDNRPAIDLSSEPGSNNP